MNEAQSHAEIDLLIKKMQDKNDNEAYRYADQLAEIGGAYAIEQLVQLLDAHDYETEYLAGRALGKMEDNQPSLGPLLEAIHHPRHRQQNGHLVEALQGFDCSQKFVDILRIYLFGNFKASALAKDILDSEEFDITPRVIRKAEKHWNHYLNNAGNDLNFEMKKSEVETILSELKMLFG